MNISKQLKLQLIIGFTIALVLFTSLLLYNYFKNDKQIDLEVKSQVENYVKFTIAPQVFPHKQQIQFCVTLESTQNQDYLNSKIQTIALLIDKDNNIYKPIKWSLITNTTALKQGELLFKLPPNHNMLKLVFFDVENRIVFTWP